MNREFSAVIRNDYAALGELSRAVSGFMDSHSVPPGAAYAADLAIEELVTNIIKYGYDDDAAHEISVRLVVEPEHLVVAIEDDGHDFDPTAVPPPDTSRPLDKREVGGLGLHLVRGVCESMNYRRDKDRNIIEVRINMQSAMTGTPR